MRKKIILTNEDIINICKEFTQGAHIRDIARKYQKRGITIKDILISNGIDVASILKQRVKYKTPTTYINFICKCGCGQTKIVSKTEAYKKYIDGHQKFRNEKNDSNKVCQKCGENQPIINFSCTKKIKTNLGIYIKYGFICFTCKNKTVNEREAGYKKSGVKSRYKKKYKELHQNDPKYWIQEKIATWRKNSCTPSDLTTEYLLSLFYSQEQKCYYSNEPIYFGSKRAAKPFSASLDKLEPSKGYVQGNVVWCSFFINTMKGNLSEKEFYKKIKLILKHKGKLND